jgi:hypothetical protein
LKRTRIPGFIDVIQVDDPQEIIELNHDARIDRRFNLRWPILNWLIVRRALNVLSFAGNRFPTMIERDSASRASAQAKLGAALDARAAAVRQGPEELQELAEWLIGSVPETQVGIAVQQVVGRLFSPTFAATQESWDAAKILVTAPRSPNVLRTVWWIVSGKLHRAKRLLAGMVDGNLAAVNGIGIAAHNIVNSLQQMKRLYSDLSTRRALSPEEAVRESLAAPVSLLRQATSHGEISGCSFSRNSLFVLAIGRASKAPGGQSLVFMDESWSGCPASQWVPAMLEGVWKRATSSR